MPGFDGTGPRGMGPMTGGGRGFCAVPLRASWPPYIGRRTYSPYTAQWGALFPPQIPRVQELASLGQQAQAMRAQLDEIEVRIRELSAEKK